MEYAYNVKAQKMISLREATYQSFYSIFECPGCHQILHLRTGKRPCFAHERTKGECEYRVSWIQHHSVPKDLPESRHQHYWLLRSRLLEILIGYHVNGNYSIMETPIKQSIGYKLFSQQESKETLLIFSSPNMQGRIFNKISDLYRVNKRKEIEGKQHHFSVYDILRVFLFFSKHFSSLQALDILATVNNGYPQIPSDLRSILNDQSVNGIVEACHRKESGQPKWEEYCDSVVSFGLNTFYYINWKHVLKDWQENNPVTDSD